MTKIIFFSIISVNIKKVLVGSCSNPTQKVNKCIALVEEGEMESWSQVGPSRILWFVWRSYGRWPLLLLVDDEGLYLPACLGPSVRR